MSLNKATVTDLVAHVDAATSNGPQWGTESTDLDMTLLVWKSKEGIAEHVNDEVDVLVVGLAGEASVAIDDETYSVNAGQAILIPKGTRRSIIALEDGFSHLNVHQRRKRLMPSSGGEGWKNRVPPS